ncbi:MAG: regulatory protein RecX [Myxococcales bacterium]
MRPVLDSALKLLAARSRSEAELRRGLEKRGYASAEVEAAVARVRELGYLDDGEVARSRARSLLDRGASPRLAARRLEAQGVSTAQARSAVDEQAGEEGEAMWLERALARRLKGREVDGASRQRVFRSFVQKGFLPSAVARALGIPFDGDDDDDR